MSELADNIFRVQERIRIAAEGAHRDPAKVTLVAVTKTFPPDLIEQAFALGIRHFGENRVEQARNKIPLVNSRLRTTPTWHMIGHIQHRKVNDVVTHFQWIHSIDSVQLASQIERRLERNARQLPALVEINVSGEETKHGFTLEPREQLIIAISEILELPHLKIQGLMTIAPIVSKVEDARPYFRTLRELRDALQARFPQAQWEHLSMGMTDDFEAAIAEGATIVRIGRAIFGARAKPPEHQGVL